jgi:prepilin-type processing-associated H-X9-DG protein
MGGGLKAPAGVYPALDPDVVVLLEPPSNHGGQGTNVLFGDWRVEWIKDPAGRAITDQANAGIRPVVWPLRNVATQPTTRPATGPAR